MAREGNGGTAVGTATVEPKHQQPSCAKQGNMVSGSRDCPSGSLGKLQLSGPCEPGSRAGLNDPDASGRTLLQEFNWRVSRRWPQELCVADATASKAGS